MRVPGRQGNVVAVRRDAGDVRRGESYGYQCAGHTEARTGVVAHRAAPGEGGIQPVWRPVPGRTEAVVSCERAVDAGASRARPSSRRYWLISMVRIFKALENSI